MTRTILVTTIVAAILLTACNQQSKQESTDATKTEKTTAMPDDIVTQSLTDKNGNTLDMSFDNTKGTATLNFKGENIELDQQRAASGIWYKNDHYELRGKGNDIWLKKDGKIIFEHEDDKVRVEAKNDYGDVLNMTFNNTAGTVKVYLNGGKQIDLVEKKAASGIWYTNDHYEFSGKGDHYKLKKGGKTVFEN